jgi:hypothetical protein
MYSRFIKLNGYPLVHHPLPEVNNYRINEITEHQVLKLLSDKRQRFAFVFNVPLNMLGMSFEC